jgi:hypothetical protein
VPTAGTPVQFPFYRPPFNSAVEVRPLSTNTTAVFIKRNPNPGVVDSMRLTLSANDNPIIIESEVLSEWYVDVTTSSEGIEVIVKVRD